MASLESWFDDLGITAITESVSDAANKISEEANKLYENSSLELLNIDEWNTDRAQDDDYGDMDDLYHFKSDKEAATASLAATAEIVAEISLTNAMAAQSTIPTSNSSSSSSRNNNNKSTINEDETDPSPIVSTPDPEWDWDTPVKKAAPIRSKDSHKGKKQKDTVELTDVRKKQNDDADSAAPDDSVNAAPEENISPPNDAVEKKEMKKGRISINKANASTRHDAEMALIRAQDEQRRAQLPLMQDLLSHTQRQESLEARQFTTIRVKQESKSLDFFGLGSSEETSQAFTLTSLFDIEDQTFGGLFSSTGAAPTSTEQLSDTAIPAQPTAEDSIFGVPQRLFVGIIDAGQAVTSSFFDNVDEEVDLSQDPILLQVKKNREGGATPQKGLMHTLGLGLSPLGWVGSASPYEKGQDSQWFGNIPAHPAADSRVSLQVERVIDSNKKVDRRALCLVIGGMILHWTGRLVSLIVWIITLFVQAIFRLVDSREASSNSPGRSPLVVVWEAISSQNGLTVLTLLVLIFSWYKFGRYEY